MRSGRFLSLLCGVLLLASVPVGVVVWRAVTGDQSLATLDAVAPAHRPKDSLFGRSVPPQQVEVEFSPDGRLLATSGDAVRLWDVGTRKLVTEIADDPHLIAFVSDDTLVTVTTSSTWGEGDHVRMWDTATGALRRVLPDTGYSPRLPTSARFWAVAVSPDHRTLALAAQRLVLFWDLTTGEWAADSMGDGPRGPDLSTLAFSPDGRLLATGDRNGMVRLWDVANRRPHTADLPCNGSLDGRPADEHWIFRIKSLAFSPDGHTLVATCETTDVYGIRPERRDSAVQAWDLTVQPPVVRWVVGSRDQVNTVTFAPDGRTLVTGGADMRLRRWDAASGNPVGTPLAGHRIGIGDLAHHPTRPLIASGSWDGTARLWRG